jgi:2-polyprenyl-3-methyl-5-hydroxy-6-metoxy-1,4-benzoquinol methylase
MVGIQERVQQMYEAHPYPRLQDPLDAERRAAAVRHFGYLGVSLDRFKGARVLDAGCGTGEKALHMASLGPAEVVGIDLSSASVRHAQDNAARFGVRNVTYRTGSLLELPFPDDSFDIVHSMGVLHHTADARRGFAELARVLKPGGIVMVSLYNSFADWLYHLERALVQVLAGDDTDRRVQVSKRLFSFRERWLAKREGTDLETRLYDKYGHPQATAHSIGEVLGWFRENQVGFHGIYPPLDLKSLLSIAARKDASGEYHVPALLKPVAAVSDVLGKFVGSAEPSAPFPYPPLAMRFLLQSALFVAGFQDYSYGVLFSGVKEARA